MWEEKEEFKILVFLTWMPFHVVTKIPNETTIQNLEADWRTAENVGAFLDIREFFISI